MEAGLQAGFGRVAVIGAGTMGAGIAAQVANAGVPVLLLDLPAAEGGRNALAERAVARLLAASPSGFMHPTAAARVEAGNTADDLPRLADCDWIVEAVAERVAVKQALYRDIAAWRRADAVVSSNTSTIACARLAEGMPDDLARHLLITHFFNPPRQMRLLELVAGARTDPAVTGRVARFADLALGKTVVACHDTPGFIANRIGAFWMLTALAEALRLGVTVEAADALLGKPFGIPATGAFGLMDLVGLDVMADIADSLAAALPPGDAFHAALAELPRLRALVAAARTGRKGGGGFYRLDRASGRGKEALDLATGEYRPVQTDLTALGRDPRAVLQASEFARAVMGRVLAYAAGLVPEVADDAAAIDTAMRLGYNWQRGPFELIDALGAPWLAERLAAEGVAAPPLLRLGQPFHRPGQVLRPDGSYGDVARAAGILRLDDVAAAPVLGGDGGRLWDIGDGIACFEATTKMGTFDPGVFALLHEVVAAVRTGFRGLVIYHDGAQFSAGANLRLVLQAAAASAWEQVQALVADGQRAFKALKYTPFPVVAAPFGLALGGGCEIVLNCDAVQAHAELAIGLVECNVGLVPGWGGCGEMLARIPDAGRVFELIRSARVSTSAADAAALGYLRPTDGITFNRDRLLADAKARALALADGYLPPSPPTFSPSGAPAALLAGLPDDASAHDRTVAGALARILAGAATEAESLALERAEFLDLARTPQTAARIAHVLDTGQTLRN